MRYVIFGLVILCSLAIAIGLWLNWHDMSLRARVGWIATLVVLDVAGILLETTRKAPTQRHDAA